MNRYWGSKWSLLLMVVSAGAGWAQTLTLKDCVRTALQHNPQLVAAAQSVVVAQQGVRQARSDYAPQLTLTAAESVRGSTGGGAGSSDGASLALGLSLWRTGRHAGVAQSEAGARAATSSLADRRLTVAELVAEDYYAVLAAAELRGVARAGVEVATAHREQVAAQIAAGTAAPVEIHTVEDDLAQARLSEIDARGTWHAALTTLKTDMGLPQTTELALAPAALGVPETAPPPAAAVASALAQRPDLAAQRAVVQARQAAVRVARANRGPVLEVSGQASQQYADWTDGSAAWRLSAGVSWPLADGGFLAAGQRIAEANLKSSEADLESLVNETAREVHQALIELERAAERIAASEEALTAATARQRGAEGKYREGLGILLEVTQARQAVTSAEAETVRARFSYQVARIALQRAMGALALPDAGEGEP